MINLGFRLFQTHLTAFKRFVQMKSDKTILLVEDDYVDTITFKRVLKKLEVHNPVVICNNGEEALNWLNLNKTDLPGLIFLDLNMPKMNGIEFLDIVKQDETLKIVPVIVLTTSSDPSDRLESFRRCVAGYMVKSVDYNEFAETISCVKTYWRTSQLAY